MAAWEVVPVASPADVLARAVGFLAAEPVRNNLILTLLSARRAAPEPGRYWVVLSGAGAPAGVVMQSPLDFPATTTALPLDAVGVVVAAVAAAGARLPGVHGEAAVAARFAGEWAELTRSGAAPVMGQRIYEVEVVVPPARPAPGQRRCAGPADRDVVDDWLAAFGAETGEHPPGPATVERRLAAGQFWLWDDGDRVALAALSAPVAGAARIGPVFTPPERRGRGYGSALVAALSAEVRGRGDRCLLYTDLANPTSNSIYRALGYHAKAEVLRYRFEPAAPRERGAR